MSTPSDTATPGTDSVRHHATLPTASDTRRQIIANYLVLFPNIVRDHITKFPTIPVRATDIFHVCVANVTRKYGSENEPKFIAKLSHAHKEHPAARMLIASGRAMSTMESALHDLLKESVDGLGVALDDMLPVREDDTEGTDKPQSGFFLHGESAIGAFEVAKEVRQAAMAYDMANETTPPSESEA